MRVVQQFLLNERPQGTTYNETATFWSVEFAGADRPRNAHLEEWLQVLVDNGMQRSTALLELSRKNWALDAIVRFG